eukprot:4150801-Amphidinium_carterae.2
MQVTKNSVVDFTWRLLSYVISTKPTRPIISKHAATVGLGTENRSTHLRPCWGDDAVRISLQGKAATALSRGLSSNDATPEAMK